MSENGKDRFVFTKSYEIAYALFRIAGTLQERDFAERLRAAAGGLLAAAALKDHPATRRSLQSIECFVKFAGDVNLLAPASADTILREVYLLDAAVVERTNSAKSAANGIDLSEIFTHTAGSDVQPSDLQPSDPQPFEQQVYSAPINSYPENNPANGNAATIIEETKEHGFMKAEMRQSAIIERIRQYGNCRLKDIQEILPGCSERTIRYDLQSLLERNLIERMGAGGPAVTYRMRQAVANGAGGGEGHNGPEGIR